MKLQTCKLLALMLMAMVGCAHEYTPVETFAEARAALDAVSRR